jgi:hypothetical protein
MPSLRCCSILLFFLAFAPSLSCSQQPRQSKIFKDMKEIIIVVENLGKEEKDLGLSAEELNAVTLVALKRDLPNLKIKDGEADAMFYVNVRMIRR